MHALSSILLKKDTYNLKEEYVSGLKEIIQQHHKLLLLLETPPVNLNYEFFFSKDEVSSIKAYYHEYQRKWEKLFIETIKQNNESKTSLIAWDGFDTLRLNSLENLKLESKKIDQLNYRVKDIEITWNDLFLKVIEWIDSQIEFPPLPAKKSNLKKKKAAQEVSNAPPTIYQQLFSLGFNKYQVKEVLLKQFKLNVLNTVTPQLVGALKDGKDHLKQILENESVYYSEYEAAKKSCENSTQKISNMIQSQILLKKKQIEFVQHWILMNMNMKGNLLRSDQILNLENFSSLYKEYQDIFEISNQNQEQNQEKISITLEAVDDARIGEYLENLANLILSPLLENSSQVWETESKKRAEQLEALEAQIDFVETPNDWEVTPELLKESVLKLSKILSIPEDLYNLSPFINIFNQQLKEFNESISDLVTKFHHQIGVQQILCEYKYTTKINSQ